MANLDELMKNKKSIVAKELVEKQVLQNRPKKQRSYSEPIAEVEEVISDKEITAFVEKVKSPEDDIDLSFIVDEVETIKNKEVSKKKETKIGLKRKKIDAATKFSGPEIRLEDSISHYDVKQNFTKVHNSLIEMMYESEMTLNDIRMFMYIYRQTVGWNKPFAEISKTDFFEKAGMTNHALYKTRTRLVDAGLIGFSKDSRNKSYYYICKNAFNIDSDIEERKSATKSKNSKKFRWELVYNLVCRYVGKDTDTSELNQVEFDWVQEQGGFLKLSQTKEYELKSKIKSHGFH